MRRIARDRTEAEDAARAAAERERLKNMTEEERREYDLQRAREAEEAAAAEGGRRGGDKAKWKFMQR